MVGRLKSDWFTLAAVALLLIGGLVLDNAGVAVAAGVLLVAGLAFRPRERLRGGVAAAVAAVVALGVVVFVRLLG